MHPHPEKQPNPRKKLGWFLRRTKVLVNPVFKYLIHVFDNQRSSMVLTYLIHWRKRTYMFCMLGSCSMLLAISIRAGLFKKLPVNPWKITETYLSAKRNHLLFLRIQSLKMSENVCSTSFCSPQKGWGLKHQLKFFRRIVIYLMMNMLTFSLISRGNYVLTFKWKIRK